MFLEIENSKFKLVIRRVQQNNGERSEFNVQD